MVCGYRSSCWHVRVKHFQIRSRWRSRPVFGTCTRHVHEAQMAPSAERPCDNHQARSLRPGSRGRHRGRGLPEKMAARARFLRRSRRRRAPHTREQPDVLECSTRGDRMRFRESSLERHPAYAQPPRPCRRADQACPRPGAHALGKRGGAAAPHSVALLPQRGPSLP